VAVKGDRHGFLLIWQAFIWSISTYDQKLHFVAPESGKLWVNVGVVAFIGDNNEYSEWAIFFSAIFRSSFDRNPAKGKWRKCPFPPLLL
jgi:hypothetical protein